MRSTKSRPLSSEQSKYALDNFCYDPKTGMFSRRKDGTRIGSVRKNKYIVISCKNRLITAHRLAWFFEMGSWPELIDHVNGDPSDNRIENLRAATKSQNAANSTIVRAASGFRGVYKQSNTQLWRAVINANGKKYSLGYFPTREDAAAAYQKASNEKFGQFSPVKSPVLSILCQNP